MECQRMTENMTDGVFWSLYFPIVKSQAKSPSVLSISCNAWGKSSQHSSICKEHIIFPKSIDKI